MADRLAIAVVPHLIPAPTVAMGHLELALSEPLAQDRDEVLYLVCTHSRLRLHEDEVTVIAATGEFGDIDWDTRWATLADLPEGFGGSRFPGSVIDPLMNLEGLPNMEFDPSKDPDGERARWRTELLPWVYDRHLHEDYEKRGHVPGELQFRLEYIGKSSLEALRRPAGAHHKVPQILGRTLLEQPSRLVYFMPCGIYAGRFDAADVAQPKLSRLAEAADQTSLGRDCLIGTAEQALIAWLGTEYNVSNTRDRVFPTSSAGDQLRAAGLTQAFVGFWGLPSHLAIAGARETVERDTPFSAFQL